MSRPRYRIGVLVALLLAVAGCGRSGPDASAALAPPLAADYASAQAAAAGFDAAQLPGTRTDWNDAALVGPHFVVEIDTIAHVPSLSDDRAHRWGLDKGLRAADGHELLLAHLRPPRRENGLGTADPTSGVDAEIRVGGQVHRLPSPLKPGETLVVSVPTGADAVLAIADSGRTQTLSLRTAKRGPDAIAAYYLARSKEVTGKGDITGADPLGKFQPGFDVHATVALRPYTEPAGWAPTGRAQLAVAVDVSSAAIGYSGQWCVAGTLDLAQSFAVKLPDGTTVAGSAGHLDLAAPLDGGPVQASRGSATVTFEVPDTTARGTVVFNPAGSLTLTALDDQATQSGGSHALSWSRHKPAELAFDLTW